MLSAENVLAGVMLLALTFYALLGGADFGGGVWDLLATGPRAARQRALITDAIGPIWEANHVWLILVIVILFTAFPPAFAAIMTALHIPLTILLIGIVLRGTAFIFRTYDAQTDDVQRRWSRVFAVASVITPIMLGICVGAIASGRIVVQDGIVTGGFVAPWLAPFPLAVGGLALALFAVLAAVYLTVEARSGDRRQETGDSIHDEGHSGADDPVVGRRSSVVGRRSSVASVAALQDDFRRRALLAALAVGVLALLVFLLSAMGAPRVRAGLSATPWAWPLQIATGVAAVGAIGALWVRRFYLARACAAVQVALIIWGWGAAQFPYLVEPSITIQDAAAPPVTLRLLLGALLAGAVVLFPSFFFLYRVFKGEHAFAVVEDAAEQGPAGR
ncbi:MAG: cytochrome d ubiquinol oxidase subunit II [Roseiflexaceae bacterium]